MVTAAGVGFQNIDLKALYAHRMPQFDGFSRTNKPYNFVKMSNSNTIIPTLMYRNKRFNLC